MARADSTESGEISVLPDLPFAESASTVFLSKSKEKAAAETVNPAKRATIMQTIRIMLNTRFFIGFTSKKGVEYSKTL